MLRSRIQVNAEYEPPDSRGPDLGTGARDLADLDALRGRIRSLVAIAAQNGSTISTEELRVLLPQGPFPSAEAMESFLARDGPLADELRVFHGEVTVQGSEHLLARRATQRALTEERLARAERFVAALERRCAGIELVAVSGSVAYGGTRIHDDVDIFLVTARHRMWACLLLAMAAAKLERLRDPSAPVYCFNRVTERSECAASFRESRDPLFAREALTLRVLRGRRFYGDLLESAPWMAEHFGALYRERLRDPGQGDPRPAGGPLWRGLNFASFLVLGPYLWSAGLWRNRRLDRDGRTGARFRTVIEPSFCAYESRKYDDLRATYRRDF